MLWRILLITAVVALVISGCGGGGGGGGGAITNPIGPVASGGTISGNIFIDQTVAGMRNELASSSLHGKSFLEASVFLEESPSTFGQVDGTGKFSFENLSMGTWHVIAKVRSLSGRLYKFRSPALSLTTSQPAQQTNISLSSADFADYQTKIQVKDLNGNLVGRCRIKLWGELFTMDEAGYYVSPMMPAGAAGLIRIEPPADKDLAIIEMQLPADSFQPENANVLGVSVPTYGITNRPPIVKISVAQNSGKIAFLRLFGSATDPEGEPLEFSWATNVSTFSYITSGYADWAVPSIAASATIILSASENGRYYPRLTSSTQLNINVASSGAITFPGEILLPPVTRAVTIVGTGTAQMLGNTIAQFEAVTDFPQGLNLSYFWTFSAGAAVDNVTSRIFRWKSPPVQLSEAREVSLKVTVSDGIATASHEIFPIVTSAPSVAFLKPASNTFEPGLLEFSGVATDFLQSQISDNNLRWYVATGGAGLELEQSGGSVFKYHFVDRGSYTVALEAVDLNGVVGTASRIITIINARPTVTILSPANNASFRKGVTVTFSGFGSDLEDGQITEAGNLAWYSDHDGFLGSGSSILIASLSSNLHLVSLLVSDRDGAVASASIQVWYDVPARITFLPSDRAVAFLTGNVNFIASGTDSDGVALATSTFNWRRADLPGVWRTAVTSFTLTPADLLPGNYRVWVEGLSNFGDLVKSSTHSIQIGWPLASITSPASGSRFDPGVAIPFAAVPAATGSLSLVWLRAGDALPFSDQSNVNFVLPVGRHSVTYTGTDSFGLVSSSTIGLVVERSPVITISKPVNGGYYYAGLPVSLAGSCLDSFGEEIATQSVSWYVDNIKVSTNGRIATVSQPVPLGSGSHQLHLRATGPYGTVATRTISIVAGVVQPAISQPVNNSTFNSGQTINLVGTPAFAGPIVFQWWANYGRAGAILIGNGPTASIATLPDGSHEISYIGTDSAGVVKQAKTNISVGQFPIMTFTPDADTVFFAGYDVRFIGSGFDPYADKPIASNKMEWFIDGFLHKASASLMIVTPSDIASYGAGIKVIELRGRNDIDAVGKTAKNIRMGLPVASILSPPADTVIFPDTTFTLSGAPDNVAPVTMEWWANYDRPDRQLLGNGQTITASLPFGEHRVTYIGTDSAGIVSSATIRLIMSDSPNITFSPVDGSYLFSGHPFTLTAVGASDSSSIRWYKNGSFSDWLSGSPVTVNVGELSNGWNTVAVEGKNILGVVGSTTNSIYYGVPNAGISSPASGTSYAIGSLVDLSGSPPSTGPISMRWYRDDGTGPIQVGTTATVDNLAIPPGLHTISYVGTDSAGFCSSASIQLLLNDPPAIEIIPASGAVFFAGSTASFISSSAAAISGMPLASESMQWWLDGANTRNGSSAVWLTTDQTAGWHTLKITGSDNYATVGQSSLINIKFRQQVASITFPASGSRYDLGDSVALVGMPANEGLLSMNWYLDGSPTPFATGANPPAQVFTPGLHTIAYVGTDSANVCSSATIMLLVNSEPAIEVIPGDGAIFFAGRPITLTGSGTSSIGALSIATSTMRWFVDGALSGKTGSPATWTVVQQVQGLRAISVDGRDAFGTTGMSPVCNITFAYPVASITSPASGTRFNIGDSISFVGSPDSAGAINMQWHLDGNPVPFGSGSNPPPQTLSPGWHSITYLGTDSANFCSVATINLLVNNTPAMEIKPGNDSLFFAGSTVIFNGSGTSVISGLPIASSTMQWFYDGVLSGKTGASPSWSVVEQGTPGVVHTLQLKGKDEYGTLGESSVISFRFGHTIASITSPASGTRYNLAANVINLTGIPDSEPALPMEWYFVGSATSFATGANAVTPALPRGLHTIRYVGTDSANVNKTATIQVLVNDQPTVDFSPGMNTYFFTGRPITFTGVGTDSNNVPLASAAMKWYLNGSPIFVAGSPVTFSTTSLKTMAQGANSLKLVGTDEFGTTSEKTYGDIYYGVSLPVISTPASGTVLPRGTQVNLNAVPDQYLPTFSTTWYLVSALPVQVLGTGPSILNVGPFPDGRHTISYVATDSSGFVASAQTQILFDDPPTMSFTPIADSIIFAGKNFTLSGSGTESIAPNPAIDTSTIRWYKDGAFSTAWKSASPVVINAGDLTAGWHDIYVVGADSYGLKGTDTHQIYYGHPVASITSPASGTQYPTTTANVAFTGSTASATISMRWYLDGSDTGVTGQNYTAAGLSNGYHTIEYSGADSVGNVTTGTIMILKSDAPVMAFTPGDGSRFFAGTSVTFTGTGTDMDGDPVLSTNMTWYLDGAVTPTKTSSPVTFSSAELSTGNHTLRLKGIDKYGTAGEILYSFYYGNTLADITSPSANTRFGIGSLFSFSGNAISNPPIAAEWWVDYTSAGPVVGTGDIGSTSIAGRGWHTLTYIATDSAGFVSSDSIQILINNPPAMTVFAPGSPLPDGALIFGGQTINFAGSGTSALPAALPAANLKWYRGGALWKTGLASFAATVADLPTGTYQIRLEGIDEFNTLGSLTVTIETGKTLPAISSPTSGKRFDTGSTVDFLGNDQTMMTTNEWLWDGVSFGIGFNPSKLTSAPADRGYHNIVYRAVDDIGSERTATISVLLTKLPTFVASPSIIFPAQYATGPLYLGNYIPIHIASAGNPVGYQSLGQNEIGDPIDPASTSWYAGTDLIGVDTNIFRNFETPGSFTYKVQIKDDYGQLATAALTFWIWDSETYPLPVLNNPGAIVTEGTDYVIVANPGTSQILRLPRITTGLTTNGDIATVGMTITSPASSPNHVFLDAVISGGVVYSIASGTNTADGYRFQSWNSTTLATSTYDYTFPVGAIPSGLNNPRDIYVGLGAIFVSDTGNNRIRKIELGTGLFYSQSQIVSVPRDIFLTGNDIYVAASGSSRLQKFAGDLNSVASWNSGPLPNACQFFKTAGNFYVSDPENQKIMVTDVNGNVLYSFGKNGSALHQGEFQRPYGVVVIANDLYVTDQTGNAIVRFRSGGW